jgi:hypothetical protein
MDGVDDVTETASEDIAAFPDIFLADECEWQRIRA